MQLIQRDMREKPGITNRVRKWACCTHIRWCRYTLKSAARLRMNVSNRIAQPRLVELYFGKILPETLSRRWCISM